MTVTNYSNARKNFKALINKVNDDSDTVTITTNNKNAVLISEDEYNQLMETVYLLQSPANAEHLSQSIKNLENDQTISVTVDE